MSVKRFDMHGSSHINGEYVSYSDCAKLEVENAALKEKNDRLLRELSDAGSRIVDLEAGEEILKARVEELETNYNDLLMCVQNKIPGVTRHDRAKQCILNWEGGTSSSQHYEECTKGANQ